VRKFLRNIKICHLKIKVSLLFLLNYTLGDIVNILIVVLHFTYYLYMAKTCRDREVGQDNKLRLRWKYMCTNHKYNNEQDA
jgi:hypothetical protein